MRIAPLLLLSLALSGAAMAQDAAEQGAPDPAAEAVPEAATPDETDAEAVPASDDPALTPDNALGALDPEAARALEALQEEETAPGEVEPEGAAAGWSYQDGRLAGVEDAQRATGYAAHALLGLGGGLVCGPCGCAVPIGELLMAPAVPQGNWQGNDAAYQRGYIDGYRTTTRNRRALYSLVGVTVGTGVAFGAGFALGVYGQGGLF